MTGPREHYNPEYPFPTWTVMAGAVARGSVRFVNIRPDRFHGYWVCDECGAHVRRSQMIRHAPHWPQRRR
jgi:hypothetical protein